MSDSDKEGMKNYFSNYAEEISRIEPSCFYHPLLEKLIKEIPFKRESKVIDIGCGTGWASRKIRGIVTNGEVVGIDFTEGMIKKAQELVLQDNSYDYENLEYKIANAESIPYPDNYFDYAIAFMLLSICTTPGGVLEEIERVLKSGGRLYTADVCAKNYPEGTLQSRLVKAWNLSFSPCKPNHYSADEYRELFGERFINIYQRKVDASIILFTVGTKK